MEDYFLLKAKLFDVLDVKNIHYNLKLVKPITRKRINQIIIHHTGKNDTVQKLIGNHIKNKNYTKIGYHFLINKNGVIYQSRDLKYVGAHCFKKNKNSIGIAFLGNYNRIAPSDKQLISFRKLIKLLEWNYRIIHIYSHNSIIYKMIKKRFYVSKLPDINPLLIESVEKFQEFQESIPVKIEKKYSSKSTRAYTDKLTTCPGINLYEFIREIER